ncbi:MULTISPECIES: J domain-containing protein [Clostridia]|uniref:J domain-containing protein n=1 Tax=Terrisporobacter glycolicus ATCC 14880 = DSM 1288 TaxID=1121315 RepID=A0ABZ2ET20_9FIRM|nr:J domain-containing protein [Terrisporobacter glycolicus]
MNIIILDEYKKLKETQEELSLKYIELVEKQEDILYKKKNYLEAKYLGHFGYLYKLKLKLEIEIRRNKRKISIIQALINRNEKVEINKIEIILQEEMKEFEEELKRYQFKVDFSRELLKSHLITDEELKEVKSIFRKLAKKLHPDINKNQNERSKNLWEQLQKAYQNNDLATLRLLLNIIDDEDYNLDNVNSLEKLKKDIQMLQEKIDEIILNLKSFETRFPFNIEEKLEDVNWLDEEKSILTNEINNLKEISKIYNDKLKEMERYYE